jgi:hypothetical protein
MQPIHLKEKKTEEEGETQNPFLSAQELLAGGLLSYDVVVPAEILRSDGSAGKVRLRPLKVATLALIAKATREDPSLIPLLMIKDALLEPALSLDQIRSMHIGLVHFLVAQINRISGLDEQSLEGAQHSALTDTHVLLARHFGWTPAQVAELTPAQVALYLAGVERLLALESQRKER